MKDPLPFGLRAISEGLVLGVALFVTACATTPEVQVRSDVSKPESAAKKSVAVVPDKFMADSGMAATVAELIGKEMSARGFQVVKSEDQAELIIIPTLETAQGAGSGSRIPDLGTSLGGTGSLGQTSMTGSRTALRSLEAFDSSPSTTTSSRRAGLMITAVSKEDWFAGSESQDVPRVWRIIAVTPVSDAEKGDVAGRLVGAVGPDLDKVSSRHAPVQSASPARKKAQ